VPKRINLVPRAERVRTTTNFAGLALLAVGVLVVFGLGFGYYLLSSERSDLTQEHEGLVDKRTKLEAEVALLQEYKALANSKAYMEEIVQGVYAGRTLVSEVLGDLSVAVPENVWFANLNLTAADPGGAYAVQVGAPVAAIDSNSSFSMDGNTYSFPDVALLLVRLRLVDGLRNISLVSAGNPIGAVAEGEEVRGFSITATVVNTQSEDKPLPVSKVVEGL
jgi:Tfp pilus assembly protein PilN